MDSKRRLEYDLSSLIEEISSIREVIAIILFGSRARGITTSILTTTCSWCSRIGRACGEGGASFSRRLVASVFWFI
ncbi:MAG: hypothetical protein QXR97_00165 [Thermoproteota archaeon]